MQLADLVARLVRDGARTVLVDGRSGSGTTTLAGLVVARWPGATLLGLDDVYPGWDGLAAATAHLRDHVLRPRAAGRGAAYRSWDWAAGRPGGWHPVAEDRPLLVEGVGSVTAEHRALADLAIWVEAPDDLRRSRALARDGETYAPHWERWAAQEEDHLRRHDPRRHADVVATAGDGDFTVAAARRPPTR